MIPVVDIELIKKMYYVQGKSQRAIARETGLHRNTVKKAFRPKKQRHTAKRIFQRLRDEYGYKGSYSTVKKYVPKLKEQRPEIFVPLEFDPAENAQVDFGEAVVIMGSEYSPELLTWALIMAHENKAISKSSVAHILTQPATPKEIGFDRIGHLPQPKVARREAKEFNLLLAQGGEAR